LKKQTPKRTTSAEYESLRLIPVTNLISNQKLNFVKEKDTVAEIIDTLAINKVSFVIVVNDDSKTFRTIDILDIVAYCNRGISTVPIEMFQVVNHLENLKHHLTKSTIQEILPSSETYNLNITENLGQVLRILILSPNKIKRIPIIQNDQVIAVISREDVLKFFLTNESKFQEKMNRTISQMKIQKYFVGEMETSLEEMLGYAFQVMWEKQILGTLASSHGSSSLDKFFNWVHYTHSASSLLNFEPAHASEESTIREVIEQILRENASKLFVMDAETKKTIGMITVTDILSLFE